MGGWAIRSRVVPRPQNCLAALELGIWQCRRRVGAAIRRLLYVKILIILSMETDGRIWLYCDAEYSAHAPWSAG